MKPPHRPQHIIIQTLYAKRNPVDATILQLFKDARLRIERVQFDGKLAVIPLHPKHIKEG